MKSKPVALARGIALALACGVFGGGGVNAAELIARAPHSKQPVSVAGLGAASYYVAVKFVDASRVRVSSGNQVSAAAGTNAAAIAAVLNQHGLSLSPEIKLTSTALDAIVAEAEVRSGRAQADWRGVYRIGFPNTSAGARQAAIDALLALSSVELVSATSSLVPPPVVTPLFEPRQGYFQPAPGINAAFAESVGLRGEGMKFVDVEYCWRPQHEDQEGNPLGQDSEQPPLDTLPASFCNHGASTVGMLSSSRNAFGMKGLATAATPLVETELSANDGQRRPAAILSAISRTAVGDVIMLEMQVPRSPHFPEEYGPAELEVLVREATIMATQAGRIVVAAAGNGSQCLDCPEYADYSALDSGALIVGAGSSARPQSLPITTYGRRVNLQGWGENVATLGFGVFRTADLFFGDNSVNRAYTAQFGGTSSATPMVAASVLLAQQAAKLHFGSPLNAFEMRQLLRATGTPEQANPQQSFVRIGPLPNIQAAVAALNTADGRLSANVTGGQFLNVTVSSLGPSRVSGRTLSFQAFSSNLVTLLPGALAANQCQSVAVQGDCAGFCAAYTCSVPEARFAEPGSFYLWACDGSGSNQSVAITASLSSSPQIDPVTSNNSVSLNLACPDGSQTH